MIDKAFLEKKARDYGIELSEKQLEQFDLFAALLVEWNEKMNLTGITEPEEIVVKHFVDCLMLAKLFDLTDVATAIDVGTGAGFPAIPLLIYKPELEMTLLDSLAKRLNFLSEVTERTGLSAELVHSRAEDAGREEEHREKYDLACARAVAPMNILCEYCLPFVKVGGYFVALKGSTDDVTGAQNAIKELGGELVDYVSYKLEDEKRSLAIIKKYRKHRQSTPENQRKYQQSPFKQRLFCQRIRISPDEKSFIFLCVYDNMYT